MRIRAYLAILIFGCLLGGFALEQVLSVKFKQLQTLDRTLNDQRLIAKDLERIKGNISQYLVSVDLILGSVNTYLAYGATRMGGFLIEDLKRLGNEYTDSKQVKQIQFSIDHIAEINQLVDRVLSQSNAEVAIVISGFLKTYDARSQELSQNIDRLTTSANHKIAVKAGERDGAQQKLQYIVWGSRLLFMLFIILLWYWANKKICRPLYFLQKSSSEAITGGEFSISVDAPKEIQKLSNDFKNLTEILFHQADHDPLTGLSNRRSFERHLTNIKPILKGMNYICFVDLDYFKTINDVC